MIDTSPKMLMFIEPTKRGELPVRDAVTAAAKRLLKRARVGARYKGHHTCVCGARSESYDVHVGGFTTNTLLAHYVECHRSEVPPGEIEKLWMAYHVVHNVGGDS